jgi:hypothetical protein
MKKVIIPILTFLLVALFLRAKAEVGMGDWQCITPGKNTIDNYSGKGITLFLSNGQSFKKLEKLEQWYFYKGFIVGTRSGTYFVANETTLKVDSFSNPKQWLEFRYQQQIDPKFWTRWYTTKWTYHEDIGFYLLIWFPVSMPLFILFVWLFYRAVRYEKLNIKKPATIIILLALLYVFVTYLLEQVPQSF